MDRIEDRRWWLACTLGLACLLGCASGGGGGPRTDAGHDAGTPLRVATFNAGLLDSVGYVAQRLPHVVDALSALDVDLLCVQEFWDAAHWDALVAANAPKRSHTLRLQAHPGASGMCTADEFDPVRSCAQTNCGSAGASDLVQCVSSECGSALGNLSSSCTSCLLANVGSGDLDAIRAACVGGASAADGGVSPDARAYLFGGSFGIGLLSSLPLVETDEKELDSSTVRRGILYAKVSEPSGGTLHVFCTHLTAVENDLKYDGSFGSWEGESAAQVDALVSWAKEKAGDKGRVLVLGDLNTGPSGAHVKAEVPDSYAKIPAAGFADPFLAGSNASCTFCADNPLVVPGDTGVDAAIDHVLTRNVPGAAEVKRIFDQPLVIDLGASDAGVSDAGSGAGPIRLSDHYGLQGRLGP